MGVLRFVAFLHVFLNIIWFMKCNEASAPIGMRSEINDYIGTLDNASDFFEEEIEALKGIFLKV